MTDTQGWEMEGVGKAFRSFMRGIYAPVRRVLICTALAMSPNKVIRGFKIVNLFIAEHDEKLFERVAQLLDLVQSADARRFLRMRRDVQRILIMHTGGSAGSYWRELNACVLDAQHLRDDDLRSVAMTLVHEATHARLERAGFGYRTSLRARIEHLCVEAEIAFAERLSESETLIDEARWAMNEMWWSIDARNDRRAQGLRALGLPGWAVRLEGFLFRE